MNRIERIFKNRICAHSGDCAPNFMCLSCQKFLLGYQAAIDELRSEEAKGLVRTTDLNPLEGADWADWLDGYEK